MQSSRNMSTLSRASSRSHGRARRSSTARPGAWRRSHGAAAAFPSWARRSARAVRSVGRRGPSSSSGPAWSCTSPFLSGSGQDRAACSPALGMRHGAGRGLTLLERRRPRLPRSPRPWARRACPDRPGAASCMRAPGSSRSLAFLLLARAFLRSRDDAPRPRAGPCAGCARASSRGLFQSFVRAAPRALCAACSASSRSCCGLADGPPRPARALASRRSGGGISALAMTSSKRIWSRAEPLCPRPE